MNNLSRILIIVIIIEATIPSRKFDNLALVLIFYPVVFACLIAFYPAEIPNIMPKQAPSKMIVTKLVADYLFNWDQASYPKFSQITSPGSGALYTSIMLFLNFK